MDDIILSPREHKVLKKFQKRLQKRYNVKIEMPTLVTPVESDVIFATINGEAHNRERVKKFLSEKVNMTAEKVEYKENILLVTLSDSEEEPTTEKTEESIIVDEGICSTSANLTHENLIKPLDSSVCIIETPVKSKYSPNHSQSNMHDETICIDEHSSLDNSNNEDDDINESRAFINCSTSEMWRSLVDFGSAKNKTRNRRKRKKMNKNLLETFPYSYFLQDADAGSCEVSSTTEESVPKKRKYFEQSKVSQEHAELLLHKKENSNPKKVHPISCCQNKSSKEEENDVIVIENPPSPIPPIRRLRPVVIDGSNVAVEHGKLSQSYSAKGIQLAVQYFLDRGHTQVTAFVPRFRRFCNRKKFPTTDAEILDDLEKNQHVVFTPSRKINGKCIASYDDRFIVQLASTNGGVIVSNDNFRDLVSESDSFKEAIENRLLMFCFVGDIFMIPSDPLGRNGPSINEYLTFPPESSNSVNK